MRSIVLLGCLMALCINAGAAAAPESPHFDPAKMMLSSDVERGMKAIGRSVFSGVEISEFNMEILAVLEKDNLGKDMIIARILDGPVVERKCGVMGGMSGSPVYIDGRLIGAVAFTWPFEKEPVAGITPIDAMLEALDSPAKQASLSPFSTRVERFSSTAGSFEIAGKRVSRVKVLPRWEARDPFVDESTIPMVRVAPPLYCAGLPKPALEYLSRELKPYGIEPVAGPGTKRDPVDVKLEPGSAFGALLVSGDVDISTGGTVTYVDGDLILGFGHPFLEMGKVDIPLTTSWVHDFVPRLDRTDKMMSPMKEIGVLSQDRNWAVGGVLGPKAGRVPVKVKVTDLTRDITKTYHIETMRHRDFTSRMLTSGILSALYASYNSPGEGMVRVKTTITGAEGDKVSREDVYYHDGMFAGAALANVMEAASLLTLNRFRPQDVAAVEYEAELSAKDNTAAIESVRADEPVAKAGEDLTLHVQLRPDAGEVIEKTVKLRMPLSLATGRIRVGVASGSSAMQMRSRVGIMPPRFYDLESVIKDMESLEKGNQLFIVAGDPTKDIAIKGTPLFGLPTSVRDLLQGSPRTDIVLGGAEISTTLDVPWVVYGSAQLMLPTEDREGKRGKVPPPSSSPPKSEDTASTESSMPTGVPASLWWASSAFSGARDKALRAAAEPVAPPPSRKPEDSNGDGEEADKADEKTKDEDKKDEDAEKEEGDENQQPKDKDKGAVARKPSIWLETTPAQFAAGELDGIAIRSDGALQLAPDWSELKAPGVGYVWTLAPGKDVVYAGTVDDGAVYRISDGECKLVCDLKRFGVSALHVNGDGEVLAATFPGGEIFRILADGKAQPLCKLGSDYVWQIIADGKSGYLAAAGPEAVVYRVDKDGKASKLADIRQSHATHLLRVGDDVYVGTAGKGAVYKLSGQRVTSVYAVNSNDVTALIAGPRGEVLLSTAPDGKVVAIKPDGAIETIFEAKKGGVTDLAVIQGRIFASLEEAGTIVEIIDPEAFAVVRDKENTQALSLCALGTALYATGTNPVAVITADLSAAAKGSLDSGILNAKLQSRWGRVDWQSSLPEGSQVSLRLRSGNSSDPKDESWSPWSPLMTNPGRDKAMVPPGQFLQYRLEMGKDAGTASPVLDWLRVSYLPANQPPEVKDPTPKEGEAISGKFKLKWKMEDPDKDDLRATLQIRARGERDYKTVKKDITDSTYEWDTRDQKDGVYDLRILVDDGLANPADSRDAELDIANVAIDNTPPEVETISGPAEQKEGVFALTGFALDANCNIDNVSWQAKGDKIWRAVRLDDGLYDWRYERFLIVTEPLKETVESITIRARDAAGNVVDKIIKLPRKKADAAKPAASS